MSKFLDGAQALEYDREHWLSGIRSNSAKAWKAFSFPTTKQEDWRYTSLKSLARQDVFAKKPALKSVADFSFIDAAACARLVFVNGRFDEALSDISLSEGLSVSRFDSADASQQALIQKHINTVVDIQKFGFAGLNGQCLDDGVFVHVRKNAVIDAPVYIVNIISDENISFTVNTRVLVLAEANSQVKVIEHFGRDIDKLDATNSSHSEQSGSEPFSNAVTELIVEDNASVEHYQMLEQDQRCRHIGSVHSVLQRSARLNSFYLSMGTLLTRVDISLRYAGEGAEGNINGVYLPQGKQHVDFHTVVEHAVPHCLTNEVFRGIAADESRAVFNGRIHIHPDAQKTEAFLSNKNLLTSDRAEIDTKPELEIYADDVRCAHGATVSQLDTEAIHYLKTRGVDEAQGLVMLSFGFINEILDELALEGFAEYCRSRISARFGREDTDLKQTNAEA